MEPRALPRQCLVHGSDIQPPVAGKRTGSPVRFLWSTEWQDPACQARRADLRRRGLPKARWRNLRDEAPVCSGSISGAWDGAPALRGDCWIGQGCRISTHAARYGEPPHGGDRAVQVDWISYLRALPPVPGRADALFGVHGDAARRFVFTGVNGPAGAALNTAATVPRSNTRRATTASRYDECGWPRRR